MSDRRETRNGVTETMVIRVPLHVVAWIDETAKARRESRSALACSLLTAIVDDTVASEVSA